MNYLGLDLGKRHDYSAIAVVEKLESTRHFLDSRRGGGRDGHMVVRYLERVPLGTRYPAVVEQVRKLVTTDRMRGRCHLVVDSTGVGEPVVDMLRAAGLGCEVTAVTITGGSRESGALNGMAPAVNVPKQDLIAGVQVMLESEELKVAGKLVEAGRLVRELMDMRVSAGLRGHVKIGSDGAGQHDDLVIALALAVWKAKKVKGTWGPQGHSIFPY